jgi:hypothetical protein
LDDAISVAEGLTTIEEGDLETETSLPRAEPQNRKGQYYLFFPLSLSLSEGGESYLPSRARFGLEFGLSWGPSQAQLGVGTPFLDKPDQTDLRMPSYDGEFDDRC